MSSEAFNRLRPGKRLTTEEKSGGDGSLSGNDDLSVSEALTLAREIRPVVSEALSITDALVSRSAGKVVDETLVLVDNAQAFLNAAVGVSGARGDGTAVATLTVSYGRGGYGQLGYGGTTNVVG